MADSLLNSPVSNVRFFGALTFTIKINQDWQAPIDISAADKTDLCYRSFLSEVDTVALLERVIGWLILLINAEERSLVLKKLCSALIAYFLKPSMPLDQCIRLLMVSFNTGRAVSPDSMNDQQPSTASLIAMLDVHHLQVILWFAESLVEEVNKINGASLQTYPTLVCTVLLTA